MLWVKTDQGAQGNEEAIAAYEAFHESIKHAHSPLPLIFFSFPEGPDRAFCWV